MTIARLIEGRDGPILSCGVDTTVREAVAILAERRIGALPVLKGNEVVGVFSERDVLYQLHSQGPSMLDKVVGEVMTSPAVTVEPQTAVMSGLALMTRRRIRHLPVVREGAMIGLVSIGDLVKFRIEQVESEAEAMRAYIQTA